MRVTLPLTPDPYPRSPLSVLDADGTSYESPAGALWLLVGGCGCGHSETLAADLASLVAGDVPGFPGLVLSQIEGRDDLYVEALLTMLDHAELIDHGGSIRASWLTDLGKQWRAALTQPKETPGGEDPDAVRT